jgi:ribosomal protein S18
MAMLKLLIKKITGCRRRKLFYRWLGWTLTADHEALAQHYEEVAKEMQFKVEEHKKILSEYVSEPWLIGKQQATGFGVHCQRLIDVYQKAAEENLEMAKMHRELAAGVKP